MWTYEQATGTLTSATGNFGAAIGYSGRGLGKNNPDMQSVEGVGPLPCGDYTILTPYDSPVHGPYVLALVPDPTNTMYGRYGFAMHGDSIPHPGQASSGCIIQDYWTRRAVWISGDHRLTVIPGSVPVVSSPA